MSDHKTPDNDKPDIVPPAPAELPPAPEPPGIPADPGPAETPPPPDVPEDPPVAPDHDRPQSPPEIIPPQESLTRELSPADAGTNVIDFNAWRRDMALA